MHPARIAELLAPFLAGATPADTFSDHGHSEPAKAGEEPAVLSPAQLHSISTYIDILLRWNARINLTAVRDPEDIVTRHFGESLFAARLLFPNGKEPDERSQVYDEKAHEREGHDFSRAVSVTKKPAALAPAALAEARVPKSDVRVADLGSGAGFPGLPLKLWAPHIALTLIESNHKKVAFLREVARALTLTDINILNTRAQDLIAHDVIKDPTQPPDAPPPARTSPHPPHALFDLVTLRAVERFEKILPTAAAVLAPGARLALLIGASQLNQAKTILPSLTWHAPCPIPMSNSRILLVAEE
jgi:16S rRNA (guanine527-N7)-methyltransferase